MPFVETGDGLRLHYVAKGTGAPLVLIHGLFWSTSMFDRLRRFLNDYRVIAIDLRGHGLSERPIKADAYTWDGFASDVVCVLDNLGIERAVVGGLSLGANVALVTAMKHPDRCSGLLLEMPVLWKARPNAERIFSAVAAGLSVTRPFWRLVRPLVSVLPVPKNLPELGALKDFLRVDPEAALAVIKGLFAGDLPAADQKQLQKVDVPALVIGHRRDPLHVIDDAVELTKAMGDARLVEAHSILEFRLHPQRLAMHIRRVMAAAVARDALRTQPAAG